MSTTHNRTGRAALIVLAIVVHLALAVMLAMAWMDTTEPCFTDECVGCVDDCLGTKPQPGETL